MGWTKQDEHDLLSFKRIIDSDDIKIKEFIKKKLINNRYIIHLLNNSELDEDCPDEYIGTSILPYYMLEPTQTAVKHYICVDVSYEQTSRYATNKAFKEVDIYVHILCSQGDDMYGSSGIARHDLLAALVVNELNWEWVAGGKMMLISDVAGVANFFATRTLRFRLTTDNNLAQSMDYSNSNSAKLVNKVKPLELH